MTKNSLGRYIGSMILVLKKSHALFPLMAGFMHQNSKSHLLNIYIYMTNLFFQWKRAQSMWKPLCFSIIRRFSLQEHRTWWNFRWWVYGISGRTQSSKCYIRSLYYNYFYLIFIEISWWYYYFQTWLYPSAHFKFASIPCVGIWWSLWLSYQKRYRKHCQVSFKNYHR